MSRPLEPVEAALWDRLRPEVEAEVRSELEPLFDEARAVARDQAMRALVISASVVLVIGLPLAAVVLGIVVRLFLWAAGFRDL